MNPPHLLAGEFDPTPRYKVAYLDSNWVWGLIRTNKEVIQRRLTYVSSFG
jgi:hypothetical protein